jgi:Ca2+-binding RTX toxin-like protein
MDGIDFLSGNNGADHIHGGFGADTLWGNSGGDIFLWSSAAEAEYDLLHDGSHLRFQPRRGRRDRP